MLLKFIKEQEEIKKIKYFPKNRRKCLLMHRADCNQTNHIGIYKKVNPLLVTKPNNPFPYLRKTSVLTVLCRRARKNLVIFSCG